MRLLKTGPYVPGAERLELIEKWGVDIPTYAILSHTWSKNPDDEVLFADVLNGVSTTKPAYSKLEQAMKRAMLDGFGWLWIDTCCINKSSSVELSEAINSMYSYYKNAQKCYAYLVDVDASDYKTINSEFAKSRWWKRGWTLQELLAPSSLEFFASNWQSLGYKDELRPIISSITGIDDDYLRPPPATNPFDTVQNPGLPVEHASIAKRMSWASARETTREEDLAYCLIGLFEVNIPMLYGEGGQRAFYRLQEEIMGANEDQSLFAWIKLDDDKTTVNGLHGLLADSPRDFRHTGSVIPYSALADYSVTTVTARGLSVTLPLTQKADGKMIAALQCPVQGRYSDWLAVYLQKLNIGSNVYARADCNKLASVSERGKPQGLYVRQPPNFVPRTVYPDHFFQLRSLSAHWEDSELAEYEVVNVICDKSRYALKGTSQYRAIPLAEPQPWSLAPMIYRIDKTEGALTATLVMRRKTDGESLLLLLGAGRDLSAAFGICEFGDVFPTNIELQQVFRPRPAAQYMELDYHTVRVQVEEIVRLEQKIYFLDIEITARPVAPTASEMIEDAIDAFDVFHKPGVERKAAKGALLGKMKRFRLT
ncbi:hypothetical protein LTR95_009492 [Oleoguttula sp. CCFEE 5521]